MKLLVSTLTPYRWIKLDKSGNAVDKGQFGEAAFISTIPKEVSQVIAVAPANASTVHQVDIPTKKRATLLAAVPFSLEDSLSEDIENLHFTVLDWSPNQVAHVAVVAKKDVKRWLEIFAEAGIKLDAIVPEYSLLPIHPDCDATVAILPDRQIAVKTSAYSSFECDEAAFEYWWSDEGNRQIKIAVNDQELAAALKSSGGRHINYWPLGDDFRSWYEQAPDLLEAAPSFLHGEFEAEHLKPKSLWLNIAAGLSVFALLLLGASHWLEADKLQARYDQSQQEIRDLFGQAFPEEEYLDRPRRQIASLVSLGGSSASNQLFQYLLGIASEIVPNHKASFEEINYRDQQLQIGILAPNFAALEEITAKLNAREGLQAALISSGTSKQRVTGQIKIARLDNDA